jgi:hypothetical protein
MKMFYNDSPFSLMSNHNKKDLLFNNLNQSSHKDPSNSDFFSINDNQNQNYQSKTKQKFAFYNNGTPSQVKRYLDYFLQAQNGNVNVICFTGNNFPLNCNENENDGDMKFKNSSNDNINPGISLNSSVSNNSQNENIKFNESQNDCSCPPPCKKSNNTYHSSYNSNNCCNDSIDKIDSLTHELGNMELNSGKKEENELINHSNERKKDNIATLRRIEKMEFKID